MVIITFQKLATCTLTILELVSEPRRHRKNRFQYQNQTFQITSNSVRLKERARDFLKIIISTSLTEYVERQVFN